MPRLYDTKRKNRELLVQMGRAKNGKVLYQIDSLCRTIIPASSRFVVLPPLNSKGYFRLCIDVPLNNDEPATETFTLGIGEDGFASTPQCSSSF